MINIAVKQQRFNQDKAVRGQKSEGNGDQRKEIFSKFPPEAGYQRENFLGKNHVNFSKFPRRLPKKNFSEGKRPKF